MERDLHIRRCEERKTQFGEQERLWQERKTRVLERRRHTPTPEPPTSHPDPFVLSENSVDGSTIRATNDPEIARMWKSWEADTSTFTAEFNKFVRELQEWLKEDLTEENAERRLVECDLYGERLDCCFNKADGSFTEAHDMYDQLSEPHWIVISRQWAKHNEELNEAYRSNARDLFSRLEKINEVLKRIEEKTKKDTSNSGT